MMTCCAKTVDCYDNDMPFSMYKNTICIQFCSVNYLTLVKMVRFLKEIYWHLMDFADNTKLHGPSYISDQARPKIERLV